MARIMTSATNLTNAEIKMLRALGTDDQKTYKRHGKEFFRYCVNFFLASYYGDEDLDKAHDDGYVTRITISGVGSTPGHTVYQVTPAGLKHLEKATGCHIAKASPIIC